jgi:hypothetical protein
MPKVERLDLSSNRLIDISALAGSMPEVSYLNLENGYAYPGKGNAIVDLEPLRGDSMPKMENLNLCGNYVTDINALVGSLPSSVQTLNLMCNMLSQEQCALAMINFEAAMKAGYLPNGNSFDDKVFFGWQKKTNAEAKFLSDGGSASGSGNGKGMEGDVESGFISASGEATVMGEGIGRDVAEIGSELTVFLGKNMLKGIRFFLEVEICVFSFLLIQMSIASRDDISQNKATALTLPIAFALKKYVRFEEVPLLVLCFLAIVVPVIAVLVPPQRKPYDFDFTQFFKF